MKRSLIILLALTIIYASFPSEQIRIEEKVDSLIKKMTLEEKIGQLNQYSSTWKLTGPNPKDSINQERYEDIANGRVGSMLNVSSVEEIRAAQKLAVENSRLGIPMMFGLDVIHGYKTTFPIPIGQAASWNMEAIRKAAEVAASEASASGINWTFSPMVDISRAPRWGRIMEGAGEDPYLGSQVARAMVRGYQGTDLSANNTIVACAKHYVGYGAPLGGRDYNAVNLSKYDLFNIFLPPFKASIKAGAGTIMNAFGTLNGLPVTGNKFLVNNILKTKWQFNGFVVSDWCSVGELITHGCAKNGKEAAEIAIKGGTDMEMESGTYLAYLRELVNSGEVKEKTIDQAVKRILTIKYKLGLFENPFKYCSKEREKSKLFKKENQNVALKLARESIVLLKNEDHILPLSTDIESIALVGPLAANKNAPLGNCRCNGGVNNAISLLEGIQEIKPKKTTIRYSKGCELVKNGNYYEFHSSINERDTSGIGRAMRIAKKSDVVIAAVGEMALMSGEARSRQNIDLPGVQDKLLSALYKTGKPVIVVLFNGRPLAIPEVDKNATAVMESWLAGNQSGNAIADVLFGKYNPSGKLPITFPFHLGQVPIFYNHLNTGRPKTDTSEVWVSQYIDGPNKPLYPFGYGLSYTEFKYSNLQLSSDKIKIGDFLKIYINVENKGDREGQEVTQLYIRDQVATYSRPVKELKGFKKIHLNPGETKTVYFILNREKLSYYNNKYESLCEPGEFEVMVGGNSRDLLKTEFELIE